MLKTILMIPLLFLFGNGSDHSVSRFKQQNPEGQTGTLEKMIVSSGNVAMDLNLGRLNGIRLATKESKLSTLRFDVEPDSFFTILVFNNELRGPLPSSMGLISQNAATLPGALSASYHQLVIEKTPFSEPFELVVRDRRTGVVFFNIEGHEYDYDAKEHLLSIKDGRLLVSKEFAAKLGRPSEEGSVVGRISLTATMRAIEITRVVDGEVRSAVLPSLWGAGAQADQPSVGTVPGPDVIVGDIIGVQEPSGGSSGGFVGLGIGTTSCNQGTVDLDWFSLPSGSNDHPVIPQNLYRMSGGASNTDRFEQIGQSWLKHAFTALLEDACGFGCNGVSGSHLGSGCSDPYTASLNYGQSGLGSRAWVNPFSGAFPVSPSPANHSGHSHTGTSHRVLVAMSDLDTTQNSGATYYAEGQYVTPHEYAWCQAHPGECNMYNNVSYRQYSVSGTTSFNFSPVAATVRAKPAINAWTGATINQLQPDPGNDGIGFVAYKVTNPSAGVWHYEYAVYNENLDRAIQTFSVPLGPGVTVSNIGFHAPPQHPGWANDGTVGSAGYNGTPWTPSQTSDSLSWSSETFAQNQNANAIRWGTLYNFRFDSNRPPQTTNATVGFFKTGTPMSVEIQSPSPDAIPSLEFSVSSYTVDEGEGSATILVTRSGNTAGTSTVDFATSDGTANQSQDYLIETGTLTFNPGNTSKTFSIPIIDDVYVESAETIGLTLSSPSGAVLGATNLATLTIKNNDFVTPTTNPIDGSRFFVRQQYFDFLQRVPDQGGEDYWTSQIDGVCSPGDTECIWRRRTDVSKAFFLSTEFSGTGGFVYRLFKAAFGEQTLYRPSYGQFMPDRARVVGGATLDQGKLDFANLFVQRSEFTTRYQTSLTPDQFVDAILQTVQQGAGVTFTPTERQSFIDDVNTGGRGKMMKNLADNAAFTQAVFNRAFVLMQYFGYFRRDPEPGGYEYWLDRLNTTNNSDGMVCSFVNSGEYELRFSPVITASAFPCP